MNIFIGRMNQFNKRFKQLITAHMKNYRKLESEHLINCKHKWIQGMENKTQILKIKNNKNKDHCKQCTYVLQLKLY